MWLSNFKINDLYHINYITFLVITIYTIFSWLVFMPLLWTYVFDYVKHVLNVQCFWLLPSNFTQKYSKHKNVDFGLHNNFFVALVNLTTLIHWAKSLYRKHRRNVKNSTLRQKIQYLETNRILNICTIKSDTIKAHSEFWQSSSNFKFQLLLAAC